MLWWREDERAWENPIKYLISKFLIHVLNKQSHQQIIVGLLWSQTRTLQQLISPIWVLVKCVIQFDQWKAYFIWKWSALDGETGVTFTPRVAFYPRLDRSNCYRSLASAPSFYCYWIILMTVSSHCLNFNFLLLIAAFFTFTFLTFGLYKKKKKS